MALGGAIGLKRSPSNFCFCFPLNPGSVLKTQNAAWMMEFVKCRHSDSLGCDSRCFYRSSEICCICSPNLETSSPSLVRLMWCFNYRADGQLDTWLINFTLKRGGGESLGAAKKPIVNASFLREMETAISNLNATSLNRMICPLTLFLVFLSGRFQASPRDGDRLPQIEIQQTKGGDCSRQSPSPGGIITRGGFTLKAIKEAEDSRPSIAQDPIEALKEALSVCSHEQVYLNSFGLP